MRRLTLILSDLYLPEGSARTGLPQTHALPSLDWLLRFADRQTTGDWRRWLRVALGHRNDGSSIAAIAGSPHMPPQPEHVWLATPVHLEARLDHARLVDRGLLRLEAGERAELCREFAGVFGPQYELRDAGERAFQLIGLERSPEIIADPARLLGADIGPALPGATSPQVRRLWTEIEMWLHGSSINLARERARKRRVSALWLWGNEAGPSPGTQSTTPTDLLFLGGDPLVRGLASGAGEAPRAASYSEADNPAGHVVAEFAPLTGGPDETLAALEQNWFAPARAAIEAHRLEYVQVVANDLVFHARAGQGWKFWRRRRNWLESLA